MNRPNVVMIVADDLGWADLGCYGSRFHLTPELDELAAGGVRFSQAYASCPVCSPSRASLLTGKYPARVGVTNWIGGQAVGKLADVPYFQGLPVQEYSLARAFSDAGYQTWHVGKWHLGSGASTPEAHGFDVNIGGCAIGSPSTYFSPYSIPTLPDGPDGEYLTDRLTKEAVDLIRAAADDDRPFFLNLWHYTVHTPIQAPEETVARYRQRAEELGLDPDPIVEGEPMPAWHLAGLRVRRRTQQSDPTYAAMVDSLDVSVGAVVAALKQTGQWHNTVIVFTSDNGGLSTAEGSPTCNAPLSEGKGWMEDGGIRVPLIVSWPGRVQAGAVVDVVTTGTDLYPTLLGAAGIAADAAQCVDGVDLWPALQSSGDAFDRGPILWHYPHYGNQGGTPAAAVRRGDWKLIRLFEDDSLRLFNLADDISEQHDLAGEQPALVAELSALLDGWLDDVGALIPRPMPAGVTPWRPQSTPESMAAWSSRASSSSVRSPTDGITPA